MKASALDFIYLFNYLFIKRTIGNALDDLVYRKLIYGTELFNHHAC